MVKRNKRWMGPAALWIILMVVITVSFPSYTIEAKVAIKYTNEATFLQACGLLKGSKTGFDLDQVPNRAQGAVMLVRLIGKESEALKGSYDLPFMDVPSWALPYVGYLYSHGLTKGTGNTTFGSEDTLGAKDFATFMLRVLGYKDTGDVRDFSWADSLTKGTEIGLLTLDEGMLYGKKVFLRDDMVHFAYRALYEEIAGTDGTLLAQLANQGAIAATALVQEAALQQYMSASTLDQITLITTVKDKGDLMTDLYYMVDHLMPSLVVDFGSYSGPFETDFEAALETVETTIEKYRGYSSMISQWSYEGNSADGLTIEMQYNTTYPSLQAAKKVAQKALAQMQLEGKTDFEKMLAIHDEVVNRTVYDSKTADMTQENTNAYTLAGVFNLGSAVCSGYADAVDYLCFLAGIPCEVVEGYVNGDKNQLHAWNIVTLEGKPYQLDATFDDPVASDGEQTISYKYFNITDQEIKGDHTWLVGQYPTCTSTNLNYYRYLGRYFTDRASFEQYALAVLANGATTIDVRIAGFTLTSSDISNLMFKRAKVSKYWVYPLDGEYVTIKVGN